MGKACFNVEKRDVYRVLVGKSEGLRLLGRPRFIGKDNIRIDLKQTGCESVDGIGLAEDRNKWQAVVNMILKLWVSENMVNFLTHLGLFCFPSSIVF